MKKKRGKGKKKEREIEKMKKKKLIQYKPEFHSGFRYAGFPALIFFNAIPEKCQTSYCHILIQCRALIQYNAAWQTWPILKWPTLVT